MDKDGENKVTLGSLTRRMLEKNNLSHIAVRITFDRRQALKDADFVCSQFRAGCLEGRIRDERISLKYGMIGKRLMALGDSLMYAELFLLPGNLSGNGSLMP